MILSFPRLEHQGQRWKSQSKGVLLILLEVLSSLTWGIADVKVESYAGQKHTKLQLGKLLACAVHRTCSHVSRELVNLHQAILSYLERM